MTTDVWIANGYGWEVDMSILDDDKLIAAGINVYDIYDFVEDITKDSYLDWVDIGYQHNEYYILLPSELPWRTSDGMKNLTKEDVDKEIHRILDPYLLPGAQLTIGYITAVDWAWDTRKADKSNLKSTT